MHLTLSKMFVLVVHILRTQGMIKSRLKSKHLYDSFEISITIDIDIKAVAV